MEREERKEIKDSGKPLGAKAISRGTSEDKATGKDMDDQDQLRELAGLAVSQVTHQ